jgi:ketosteroid isomerase-like protein
MSKERAALIKAEAEWARGWSDKQIGLVMLYFADDAVLYSAVRPRVDGRAAIGEFLQRIFLLPGLATRFAPERAEVSAGGDLGFTLGTYQSTIPDAGGKDVTHSGHYVCVWKKHFDGSWRIVVHSATPEARK